MASQNFEPPKNDLHLDKFHKYMQALLKNGRLVMDSLEEYGFLSDARQADAIKPISQTFKLYYSCYNRCNPEERFLFAKRFKEIYVEHRGEILQGLEHLDWLSKGKIKVIFVADNKNYIVFPLSNIFQLAYELRKRAHSKIKQMDLSEEERADEEDKCDAIFYIDQILLNIYNVFYSILEDTQDRMILNATISKLADAVGIDDDPGLDNGIQGIVQSTYNLISKTGLLPEGANMNSGQIEGVINSLGSIFENSNAKEMFSSMFKEMEGATDLKGVVKSITKHLGDEKVSEIIEQKVNEFSTPAPPPHKEVIPGSSPKKGSSADPVRCKDEEVIEVESESVDFVDSESVDFEDD